MIRYQLANLNFSGVEITQTEDGWCTDKLRFLVNDLECTLRQVPNHGEVIKQLSERKTSGITATLEIRSLTGCAIDQALADDLVDGISELLSLATKNTVYWTSRETFDAHGRTVSAYSRNVSSMLRPIVTGWSLIPDFVAVSASHFRVELAYFLGSVSAKYLNELRPQGLNLAIAWILDSEHQSTVDMKYVAAFIAIERLRVSFLQRDTLPPTFGHHWHELLDNGLGDDVIATVEKRTGVLSALQKRLLITKLHSANNPPVAIELEALCRQLGVEGFEKDMGELRAKLVHTGAYGDFEFPRAIELYRKLSHLIDLCVLKLCGYDGYYHHWATDWKPMLTGHTDSAAA